MKKTGLYFGSFNPVHTGHLIVAEYFATQGDVEEVWFVVSPQNPFKQHLDLAPEHHRVEMVKIAIADNPKLAVCDVELSLPKPSYTCTTLRQLALEYPEREFTLLLGEDSKNHFDKWKDSEWILQHYPIRFFPRHGDYSIESHTVWAEYDVQTVNAPRIEISSTQIRKQFKDGSSNRYLLPQEVIHYIEEHALYV